MSIALSLLLLVTLGVALAVQKHWDPHLNRLWLYLSSLAVAAAGYSCAIFFVLRPDPAAAVTTGLRDFLAFVIVTAFFGVITERVTAQRDRAEQALEEVARQRDQILMADEQARRDVADYLHDTVQGDLVVLAMQLESMAERMPPTFGEPIRSVIEELESVRLHDVRTASRRLSPDIATLGLLGALHEAAHGYTATMQVSIECPEELPGTIGDERLAIYRIVEQALLNAAVHGKAQRCSVLIEVEATGDLIAKVTNNGSPLESGSTAGSGSAVIDAWVNRFGGSWELRQRDGVVVLTARLKVTGQQLDRSSTRP